MQEIILKNNTSEHFTLITYPDGQHSIKLNIDKLNIKYPITIKCRIRNFSELEVLLCLVSSLRKNDFYIEGIEFVYLFGMRSDRSFCIGEPNYFRDVVSPILKLLNIRYTVMAPHNLCQVDRYYFIHPITANNDSLLIGGDQSVKKWYEPLDNFFIKERKEKIVVRLNKEISENFQDIVIIDDLCDGGATFIAEGEYLKKKFPDKKLKLFVYHGLFTQGIHPLLTYFDEIICTNSYQDIDHPKVTQIKVI